MRMNGFTWISGISTVLLWVSANILGAGFFEGARLDLSADQAFSLRPATGKMVDRLGEPVTLTLYSSAMGAEDRPELRGYARRVAELLDTFAARAGGDIILRKVDTSPGLPGAAEAEAAGIFAERAPDAPPLFFGIAGANRVDSLGAIPRLDWRREASLESEIALLIGRLDDPSPKRLAIVSSLPFSDASSSGLRSGSSASAAGNRSARDAVWGGAFYGALRRAYKVERLSESFDAISPATDILLVIHPFPLSDRQIYVIEQFILAKGRALIALDPLALSQLSPSGRKLYPGAQAASALPGLLKRWGVSLSETALPGPGSGIRADSIRPIRPTGPANEGPANEGPENEGPENEGPAFLAPGFFTWRSLAQIRHQPLIRVSGDAEEVAADQIFAPAANSPTRAGPDPLAAPPPAERILALRVSGVLQTAFPNGSPPRPRVDAGNPDARQLLRSGNLADVILVADSDVISPPILPGEAVSDKDSGAGTAFMLDLLGSLYAERTILPPRSGAPTLRPLTRRLMLAGEITSENALQRAQLQAVADLARARLIALATVAGDEKITAAQSLVGDFAVDRTPEDKAEIILARSRAFAASARLTAFDEARQARIRALDRSWMGIAILLPALVLALIGTVLALRRQSLKIAGRRYDD